MEKTTEWIFDIEDAAEEARQHKEENTTCYSLCDIDLLEYSLGGCKSFDVYGD